MNEWINMQINNNYTKINRKIKNTNKYRLSNNIMKLVNQQINNKTKNTVARVILQ